MTDQPTNQPTRPTDRPDRSTDRQAHTTDQPTRAPKRLAATLPPPPPPLPPQPQPPQLPAPLLPPTATAVPPTLVLAQNCGLHEGPTLQAWKPALEAARALGARCAFTFFNERELELGAANLTRAGLPAAATTVVHCGHNPFGSLFLGFVGGELFAVNRELLLLSFGT